MTDASSAPGGLGELLGALLGTLMIVRPEALPSIFSEDEALMSHMTAVLPVLAAAIFIFRSQAVINTRDAEGIKEIFGDGAELRVAPLLQHFIFPRPVRARKPLATAVMPSSNSHSSSAAAGAANGQLQ